MKDEWAEDFWSKVKLNFFGIKKKNFFTEGDVMLKNQVLYNPTFSFFSASNKGFPSPTLDASNYKNALHLNSIKQNLSHSKYSAS